MKTTKIDTRNAKPYYLNRGQMEVITINAKDTTIVAGRGFGKSEGVDAMLLLRNVQAMPRSHGGLISPSYSKLLQNTLPAVKTGLAKLGFHQNIHYFIGVRPPKEMNWPQPYVVPDDYKHSMSWYNGTIISFISFERAMSANSKSFDWVMGFEAKFLNAQKIQEELLQAIRGKREIFGHCPWHHGTTWTTDMPTLKSGNWIFKKQETCDENLMRYILHLVSEKQKIHANYMADKMGDRQYRKTIGVIERELTQLRRKASLYREYDSLENIEILGESFIRTQARDLPSIRFLTSILNQRPRKIQDGFYSALSETLHYYISENSTYLDALPPDSRLADTCIKDGDIDMKTPLCIALDYNSSINNLVTGQEDGRYQRTVKSMYVKTPLKLQELVSKWCDYYEPFLRKNVIYYYDSTAVQTSASSNDTFKDIVVRILREFGWNVLPVYIGDTMDHHLKHQYIDMALKGDPKYLYPKFNKFNCENLLTSMEQTGTVMIGNKVKKDKSDEKKPDSPELPDEFKPHANDAWDTLFIGMNMYRRNFGGNTDIKTTII